MIWRGVLQPALADAGGVAFAVVIQAASFGLHHAHGFPRGPIGVGLVFVWALMLGALRHRSRGVLAPLLAHLVADAVIAGIVIGWVLER